MAESLIEIVVKNFKKYLYALFGLVVGVLFVEYGFLKTILIVSLVILCFKLGDIEFKEKILTKIFEGFKRLKKNLSK